MHAREIGEEIAERPPLLRESASSQPGLQEYQVRGPSLDGTRESILRFHAMSPKSKLPVHGSSMGISPSPASGTTNTIDNDDSSNPQNVVTTTNDTPRRDSACQQQGSPNSPKDEAFVKSAATPAAAEQTSVNTTCSSTDDDKGSGKPGATSARYQTRSQTKRASAHADAASSIKAPAATLGDGSPSNTPSHEQHRTRQQTNDDTSPVSHRYPLHQLPRASRIQPEGSDPTSAIRSSPPSRPPPVLEAPIQSAGNSPSRCAT